MKISAKVETKLKQLPTSPGVYFHKNAKKEIIYVGKAAVLKNRVRQYFQESRTRDAKTEALVAEIDDIEWIEVDSEIDALFLEAELVKRYLPKFNIMLRDDKSSTYVRIDARSDHPTVQFVRRPADDDAKYFGPFLNGWAVKKALRYLRRIFPFDMKKQPSGRVSLDYHIGLSPGLEEGKTTLTEYRKNLRHLTKYLKGERSKLVKQLNAEMERLAKAQKFEEAGVVRNQMLGLKELNKKIFFSNEEFMDVSKDQALSGLMDLLRLQDIPARIEGYDISHLQGTNNVASMVVFANGIPDKTEYRKFKMQRRGNNDYAHMNEVITRRFRSDNLLKWPKPDLVLIDGGKGQVTSAIEALEEYGIRIPVIGIAKRFEEIIIPDWEGGFEVKQLSMTSHTIKLLQRIRDESHRFALTYQRTTRTIAYEKKHGRIKSDDAKLHPKKHSMLDFDQKKQAKDKKAND